MIKGIVGSLVTLGLSLSASAHAQPKDLSAEAMATHLSEVGTWKFSARKKGPDGKPECVETWHFNADGTGWVQSGEQRVDETWRTELDDTGDRWLMTISQRSTPGIDCMGRESDPASYPKPEGGFVVMFFNSGGAYTCRPAAYIVDKDGNLTDQRILRDEDCWGRLDPMAQE